MRIVFFGTGDFAVPILDAIAGHVVLVVTQPDRPAGRGLRPRPSPVKQGADRLGLPVDTPERAASPDFVERVRSLRPTVLVVADYGQILPQGLLDTAIRGGINLHASLLPKYRGAAPIQRAILEGERETGVTLMQMDKGMDTGDIIASQAITIGSEETAGQLEARLARIAAGLLTTWLPDIEAGTYPRNPQDSSRATYAPKVTRDDVRLDFALPAADAHRRYRAGTPKPGARLATSRGDLLVLEARLDDSVQNEPGRVLEVAEDGLLLAFDQGALLLRKVQLEGRTPVSGRDLANGWRLRPGDSLLPV